MAAAVSSNKKAAAAEVLPVKENDAMIFIPSKGRANLRSATWNLLTNARVNFTVVVEPQEEEAYRGALANNRYATVAVLPLNNQGVSFARNHILYSLAPRSAAVDKWLNEAFPDAPKPAKRTNNCNWFWIMDDDIGCFYLTTAPNEMNTIAPGAMLRDVYGRVDKVIQQENKRGIMKVPAGMFALEYSQFAVQSERRYIIANSYMNIAVLMTHDRLPRGIRYRFRVREDYDFALQVIRSGRVNVRFKDIGFRVPPMQKNAGGMTAYYNDQKNRDIRKQNELFIQTWGGQLCKETVKGTGVTERYDIKVNWQKLVDYDAADKLLKSVPGVPPEDPLEVPMNNKKADAKDTSKGATTKALSRILLQRAGARRGRGGNDDHDDDSDNDDDDDEHSDEDSDDDSSDAAPAPKRKPASKLSKAAQAAAAAAAAAKRRPAPKAKAKKTQVRRRLNDDDTSSSEEESSDDEDDDSDDAVIDRRKTAATANKKPQPKAKKPSAKKPAAKPGWTGWKELVYREINDDVIAAGGLTLIESPEMGDRAVFIPTETDAPTLMRCTIVDVRKKRVKERGVFVQQIESIQVSPDAKGFNIRWVDDVFKVPRAFKTSADQLEVFFDKVQLN